MVLAPRPTRGSCLKGSTLNGMLERATGLFVITDQHRGTYAVLLVPIHSSIMRIRSVSALVFQLVTLHTNYRALNRDSGPYTVTLRHAPTLHPKP